jgi:hypothetical protein
MQPKNLIRYVLIILLFPLLLTTGCNLFSAMHTDGKESNASVLVADGKAAMKRGDYVKAAEYFRLAIEHNSRNSEARVGYAEAYLQAQGFSLGEFINSLFSGMDSESGSGGIEFVDPAHWGVATLAEVEQILQTLIFVLEPIALGQTDGPYAVTDFNVNLTTGLFYILLVAAQMQGLGGSYQMQKFNKYESDGVTISAVVAGWGLPVSILNQLPDEFLWIADSGGNQPSPGFLISIQSSISLGLARLRIAANNASSSSQEILNDIIDLFDDWEILAYQ